MIKVILTDIEGTISSIDFVRDVLFPYAHQHLEDYLREHQGEKNIQEIIDSVAVEAGRKLSLDETISQLKRWIDEDRKVTPLKTLQGLIWRNGFETGEFKGHLYDDAIAQLKEWKGSGIPLYVYSSGSIQAQLLYFQYSVAGDIRPLFSGHFDTTIGPKKESDSYRVIGREIEAREEAAINEILFLSDVEDELEAAQSAGMEVILLNREKNPDSENFRTVDSLKQIALP